MEMALDQPGNLVGTVLVYLAVEYPGVVVPHVMYEAAEEGILGLRYSLRYGTRIFMDREGIRADLSKQGVSYETFVPWDAILAITEESTHASAHWPVRMEAGVADTPVEDHLAQPPTKRHLRVVKDDDPDA